MSRARSSGGLIAVGGGVASVLLGPEHVLRGVAQTETQRLVVHCRRALVAEGGPLVAAHRPVEGVLGPVLRFVGALLGGLQVGRVRGLPRCQPGEAVSDLLGAPTGRVGPGGCRRSRVPWLHCARPPSAPVSRSKLSTSGIGTPDVGSCVVPSLRS